MAQLQCIVVTPEATALDEAVEFVALPLYDGEIGIAPGHSPLIGRLGYGELRARSGGRTKRYYIDGGFVQVADNVVSVLTGRAVPAEQIDAAVAAEHLKEARTRRAHDAESLALRGKQQTQARAMIRVARGGAKVASH